MRLADWGKPFGPAELRGPARRHYKEKTPQGASKVSPASPQQAKRRDLCFGTLGL
jgi:hypothetical protein